MAALFYPLLVAHLVGDFALQTDWMITFKRRHGVMGVLPHVSVVTLVTLLAVAPILPTFWPYALFILLTHLLIDAAKVKLDSQVRARWMSHALFILDQVLHLIVLYGVAQGAADAGIAAPWAISLHQWRGMVLGVCAIFVLAIVLRVFLPTWRWPNRWAATLARTGAFLLGVVGMGWLSFVPIIAGLHYYRHQGQVLTRAILFEGLFGGLVAMLFGWLARGM